MSEERAPITFHLEELRRRIIVCLVAWLVGSIISYIYAEDIIAVISAPAGKLYFLNPAEVFFSYIEIAAFAGFIGTLPIHCFEFWTFSSSCRRRSSSSWALPRLPCSPCSLWRRTCLSSSPSCCPSPWALNCPWSSWSCPAWAW